VSAGFTHQVGVVILLLLDEQTSTESGRSREEVFPASRHSDGGFIQVL
jgi:hypothetical protein